MLTTRRFHKLYERILLSHVFSLAVGWLVSVLLPFIVYWGTQELFVLTQGQKTAVLVTSLAFIASHFAVRRLYAIYPGERSSYFVIPQVLAIYALLALSAFLLQVEISRLLLVVFAFSALAWFLLEHLATKKYRRLKLAIIPGGAANSILALTNVDTRILAELQLGNIRYDAIVADFETIDDNAQRFVTRCALDRLAVYDARIVYESLSGRVKINRMSENNIGALLPTPLFEFFKRVTDWMLVILSVPVALPICIATAVLIKLESPGPIIFRQKRIGQGNRTFIIYKFRSMYNDNYAAHQFAGENDPRTTRIGRIIRKLRIDELPQLWNVVKGEMSVIGPRPEQPGFVDEFDRLIPFYSYRHVVKPGITGWAQVRYGYASDAEETQVKIEHDFYYIKNCSLYLDLVIILMTIRTILTGFGAR